MPFGSPSATMCSANPCSRFLLNIAVFGMPPQDAVDQPRFASYSFPGSSEPHTYMPGRMSLERRFPDATADALTRLGHDVNWWPAWEWQAGAVCTILANQQTGMMEGAADIRRPGGVRGW